MIAERCGVRTLVVEPGGVSEGRDWTELSRKHAVEAHRGLGVVSILGGKLSALDGIRPEDLNIASLLSRVEEGGVDEVVLAMNARLEGQTTAHYLAERLDEYPVRITQLAHGLPVGGELDYLDEGTLAQALRARRPLG